MDSIYGNVLEKENILTEFYSAKQRDNETCFAWSCRLEEILCKAMKMDKVQDQAANEIPRTVFYKSLSQDLKDISGHLFHSFTDFDELRVEIRKLKLNIQFRANLSHNLRQQNQVYLRLKQQIPFLLSLKIFRLSLIS